VPAGQGNPVTPPPPITEEDVADELLREGPGESQEGPEGGEKLAATPSESANPTIPSRASELLRFVREMLAEWFSRGDLLLRAWRQYDPEGRKTIGFVNERPALFLELFLRRLNEYHQAVWIDYVRTYEGFWHTWTEKEGNNVFLVDGPERHADRLLRKARPLEAAEALRLLEQYARGGEGAPALHVPLVNAFCFAIANTIHVVPNGAVSSHARLEPGPFAPEGFLAPRLAGLRKPVPEPLWQCLSQFLEEENDWGRFNSNHRSALHKADRCFDSALQSSGSKTVLNQLRHEWGLEPENRGNLQAFCEKLEVLGDLAVRLREIFPPEIAKQIKLPWIPVLIQNMTRLGLLADNVLGDQTAPSNRTRETIRLDGVSDQTEPGQPRPLTDEQLRLWSESSPLSESEIVQFAGAVLERWFARGHELLSAWQRLDPDAKMPFRAPKGKTSPFLAWLLRRCNEYRQAAWIEYVLRYGEPWYVKKEDFRSGRIYVVHDPAKQTDRLWRRMKPFGPEEALVLLRAYAAAGEEAEALHGPLINAVSHAIAGTVVPPPTEAPGPFSPEHFLSPNLYRSMQPVPHALKECLKVLLVVEGEGGGRFNHTLRASLRAIAPQRFAALYTDDIKHLLGALTGHPTRPGKQDNLKGYCVKLEALGAFARRLQHSFPEAEVEDAGLLDAVPAMQNLVRLGHLATNVLGDRSPPPPRPVVKKAPPLASPRPYPQRSPTAAGQAPADGILHEAPDTGDSDHDLEQAAQVTVPPLSAERRRSESSTIDRHVTGSVPTGSWSATSANLDVAAEAGSAAEDLEPAREKVPWNKASSPADRSPLLTEGEDSGPTAEELQPPGPLEQRAVVPARNDSPTPEVPAATPPQVDEGGSTVTEAEEETKPLSESERLNRLAAQFDTVKRFRQIASWGNKLRERCREEWPEAVEGLGVLLATYHQFKDGLLRIEPQGAGALAEWIEAEQGVLADSLVNNIELLDALLPPEGRDGPEPPPDHLPAPLVEGVRKVQRRVFEFMHAYGQYDYYPLRYGDEARDHPGLEILGSVPTPGMRSFCVVQIVQPGYIKPPGGRERPVRAPKVLVAR
jgi:hypothetical protein